MPDIIHPAGEVVISVRPVSVFAEGPGSEIEQLRGRWRQAARPVMVLLPLRGLVLATSLFGDVAAALLEHGLATDDEHCFTTEASLGPPSMWLAWVHRCR